MHFFVFEPRALVVHAACSPPPRCWPPLYPMRLVVALPIAATLRREMVT